MATKIISIHSYRGGTGKSNTTANLASQLAMLGRRVAIVDTDIPSPGIHILFGLDEAHMGHTLNQFLHGECDIESVGCAIGEQPDGAPGVSQLRGKDLWLLPASPNRDEIARILQHGYDVSLLNKGIQTFRRSFNLDYLFIDTHPGLNDETLLSIAVSDLLIVILRPDNQDFQGTIVTVDVARKLDVSNLEIVVNKALLSKYDAEQIKSQVESTYQVPVLTVLPLAEDVVDNASADIFSLAHPENAWSQRIKAAAESLDARYR
jgi:MinD-like ATPase involved in chromosome partitioning or flagellar assembly